MQLHRLRAAVKPPHDFDSLLAIFQQKNPRGNGTAFALHLQQTGIISPEDLRDWMLNGDIQIDEALDKRFARLGNKHELISLLGRGAMGEVYLARDPDLNRHVAVKLIDPHHNSNPNIFRRFANEIQITAQLDHPGIVPVYGLEARPDGRVGYTMRIVHGRTLREYMNETIASHERRKPLNERHQLPARLQIFLELCNTIHYAHTRSVIHRDLKPPNIMIGEFGEVFVMDWGIAKVLSPFDEQRLESSEPTVDGEAIGTPSYMAPEQAQGHTSAMDAYSDQFSLGLILYELASLQKAYQADNIAALLLHAASAEKRPLRHRFDEYIPKELAAIIGKATERMPANRYPSVEALAEDIRRYLRDEAVVAAPDNIIQRAQRWIARHRTAVLAAMVALGGLSTAGIGIVIAGSTVGYAAIEQNARHREQKMVALVGAVGNQSAKIDRLFLRYSGLLDHLAGAARITLSSSATSKKLYDASDFFDPALAPPDLVQSSVYNQKVSFEHSDIILSPKTDPAKIKTRLEQIAGLQPTLREILLRGYAENGPAMPIEAQQARILRQGSPAVWSYIALEEGVLMGYPGTGVYPPEYDPRRQPWYRRAMTRPGPQWEASEDESGQGMLVTVSSSVKTPDRRTVGVVGLDLSLTYIAKEFLHLSEFPQATPWLIDQDGKVVAGPESYVGKPFPWPDLHARFLEQPVGNQRVQEQLMVWSHIDAVHWTYVISGTPQELFGE